MMRVLQRHHQLAHAEPAPTHVEQRIDHELAGTVIRDLAAAIDLHQRNVARREHVLACRIHAEREDRRMLEKPDFIARLAARAAR